MVVERFVGKQHQAVATGNDEAFVSGYPAASQSDAKEGGTIQQTGEAGDVVSAIPRRLSLGAQGAKAGALNNSDALPAPRQVSEQELRKAHGAMEEVAEESTLSAGYISDLGSDAPEAAAVVPVPTPPLPVQAASVTTHKKTFEGRGWSSLLSSMRDTVECTLRHETSMATGLPGESIRVVSMSVEGDSTLLTGLALVHDATKSAVDLDRDLNLYSFEGMQELLETRALAEVPQPSGLGASMQGTATSPNCKAPAIADSGGKGCVVEKAEVGSGGHDAHVNATGEATMRGVSEHRKKKFLVKKATGDTPRQKTVNSPRQGGKATKKQNKTSLKGDPPHENRRESGSRTEGANNNFASPSKTATLLKRAATPRATMASTPRGPATPRTTAAATPRATMASTPRGPATPRVTTVSTPCAGATTPRLQRLSMRYLPFSSRFVATVSPTAAHLQTPIRPLGLRRVSATPERHTPRRHLSHRISLFHGRSVSQARSPDTIYRESKYAAQVDDVSGTKPYGTGVQRGEIRSIPPQRIIRLGVPSFRHTAHNSVAPRSLLSALQASEKADDSVGNGGTPCASLVLPLVGNNDGEHDTHIAGAARSTLSTEAHSERNHALLEKTLGVSRRSRSPVVPLVEPKSTSYAYPQM
ncbi:hypothetical protein TraAM80_01724 [Trypanosoma rangeli]|uniref:Flagellar attachment zone protein 1 conserved domain-containing protein n=1 Tax=Trypanosoma rangeli TaxID=5698 RepID=A0A3S5IS73_TRYRA|nr:uncharacterized protein TraAM80_01724 [Trypanosoma rangeli]RNF10148.1 hypothetical protein TraAM80_01724 [Trypanosoma rangeli]|eukprot:RNF10148.1 hypothetical protein TraAM80_01724 [Trypanosoma rangeli]